VQKGSAFSRGFTLIEVMVVIVILGILAALVVPRVVGETDKAKVQAARTDIATLKQSLKRYYIDSSRYPTTEQGLQAIVTKPTVGQIPPNWGGPYIERLPKDPWGGDYQYVQPGIKGGEFDIFSYGKDGKSGGEGYDADIGSWE
jgi:general secretion pathway protein G